MDKNNLKTASTYVNNLLLARGLLRDGKPVDFVRATPKIEGNGITTATRTSTAITTMGQILNLVHDLVLRHDVCLCIFFFLFLSLLINQIM